MRSIARKLVLVLGTFVLWSLPAFAQTGGTCPTLSGGNTVTIQGVAYSSFTAAGINNGCFYVSSTLGSDSNAGTTEGAPWAHAPGMANCTGVCASTFGSQYSTKAGYGIILRGGDSWGAASFGWQWAWSGTASHPNYLGVDPTWYNSSTCSGGWCRPIFNLAQSAISGSYYTFLNNGATAIYTTVDNFEETGWSCATTGQGSSAFVVNTTISPYAEFENIYFHGVTYSSGQTTNCYIFAFGANTSDGDSQVAGTSFHNNVVDNSDQNPSPGSTGISAAGCALHGVNFYNNVCRYVYNTNGKFTNFSGNWMDHFYAGVGTSPDHCNMANMANLFNGATSMVAANNVFSYMECSGGEILWLSGNGVVSGSNWYAYNNLFYQVASGGAQRITTCTHPTGVNCGTYWLFNNTDSNSGGQLSGNGETPQRGTVNLANNHIIGTDTLCENTGVTCNDEGNELLQCAGTGSGCADQNVSPNFNQYSDSQTPYADAPVASTNSTVGAGQDACTTLGISCTGALASATSDTTYASENTTNHTVVMRTVNARGSTWDIGAYQFAPSTNYTLTVNVTGTSTDTVTDNLSILTGCNGSTSPCSASYSSGTVVTLTATAGSGQTFTGWSGSGCSGTGTCSVTMSAAESVTATFTGSSSYTLSVTTTGSGSVSSSPSGIASCSATGGTCSASFSSGTVVTLTETASASYYPFQSWSGSCSGSGACSVTMSAAEAVGAEFCGPPQYPCSSVSTAIKQTPNSAPFSGGTGYNQVAYDTSGLNAIGLNPLVRITDATMLSGHSPSSTFTGGDNDAGWSCTGRADLSAACGAASLYYYAVTEGGAVFFEGIKYVGGKPQVVAPLPSTSSPLFSPQGAPAFASTDPSTAYEEIGATGTGGGIPAIKKVVLSWSGVVGQSPTFVESTVYNFAQSCSVLPNGYGFGEQYSGGLSHDSTDNIFAVPLSNVRPVSGTTYTATVANGSTAVTFTTSAIGSATIHSGSACTSCTYAVGDVATIVQSGASGGKIVVTAVSSGTPTAIAVWTVGTLYSTATSLSTTGGSGSGLQVDITNGMLTDSSYNGAQVTLNGVSGTYRIVSNTLTGFTISPAFSGTGCATTCTMTIGGGQGTGHWLLAYQISPAACAVYNTNTGAVLASGAWTGGTIDTGCTGMLIHDGFLFHTGQYGQWSGASTGTSCGTQSTFWETGTAHAVPCTATVTGGGALCGGHNTFGFNHETIISNPNFFVFPPSAANSGTPYSSFGSVPLTGGAINCENHFSWQAVDANDTFPVIGATANVNYSSSGSTSTYGYPTMNEVYVLQQNGTLSRMVHSYILGSSSLCGGGVGPFSAYFNAGESIGVPSQDGTMFAFSSDMLGQLGLDADSATRADIFVVGLDQQSSSSMIFTAPSAPNFAKMPVRHEPDPRLVRISDQP